MLTDFKTEGRIRDPDLLRRLHLEWKECALCGSVGLSSSDKPNPENLMYIGLSLHHILKHPRDDIRGNLVMLCGHGTAGCHGLVEAHDATKVQELGRYIIANRGDVISHLYQRMGVEAAQEYLRQQLLVDS
jgi:hypothetical protein